MDLKRALMVVQVGVLVVVADGGDHRATSPIPADVVVQDGGCLRAMHSTSREGGRGGHIKFQPPFLQKLQQSCRLRPTQHSSSKLFASCIPGRRIRSSIDFVHPSA